MVKETITITNMLQQEQGEKLDKQPTDTFGKQLFHHILITLKSLLKVYFLILIA